MNRKQLSLIISARNNTDQAFGRTIANLKVLQYQLGVLSLWGVTFPRTTAAGFGLLSLAIQATLVNIGRFTMGAGVMMARLGAVFDRSGMTLAGKFSSSLGVGLNLIGRSVGMLGRTLQPMIAIFGSLIGLAFRFISMVGAIGGEVLRFIGGIASAAFDKLRMAATVAGAAMVAAFSATLFHGMQVNMMVDSAQAGFSVLLRSISGAASLTRELRKEARSSAFDFLTLAQGAQELLAFQFAPSGIMQMVRVLSDTAFVRGIQGAEERFQRLILVLGQIKSKGLVQGEEIRQLSELGINARAALSIPGGYDVGNLKISAARAIPVILQTLQSTFGGLQTQMMNSTQFILSALRDDWDYFSSYVTEGFQDKFNVAIKAVSKTLQYLLTSRSGMIVTSTLRGLFTSLGTAIANVAGSLPSLIDRMAGFFSSDKWTALVNGIIDVVQKGFTIVVKALNYLQQNWSSIWPVIRTIAGGALTFLVGMVGGFTNVLVEMTTKGDLTKNFFSSMGDAIKTFAVIAVQALTNAVRGIFQLQAAFGLVQGFIGILMGNPQIFASGAAAAIAGTAGYIGSRVIGENIKKDISNIDFNKIFSDLGNKFKDTAKKPGVFGAFARGWLDANKQVEETLRERSSVGSALFNPTPMGTERLPGLTGGKSPGSLPEVSLQVQVGVLQEQVESWKAIGEAIKMYTASWSDSNAAAREQLTALLGQLGAVSKLRDTQAQLLNYHNTFSKEWFNTLEGMNQAAAAANKLKGEIREILFDTGRLQARASEFMKLQEIGAEAGFSPQLMRLLQQQQVNTLTQQVFLERDKLSTMVAGTDEWYKQRSVILDIVLQVVKLRNELNDVNGKIAQPKLLRPRGITRGAPFGPELGYSSPGNESLFSTVMRVINPGYRDLGRLIPNLPTLPSISGEQSGGVPDILKNGFSSVTQQLRFIGDMLWGVFRGGSGQYPGGIVSPGTKGGGVSWPWKATMSWMESGTGASLSPLKLASSDGSFKLPTLQAVRETFNAIMTQGGGGGFSSVNPRDRAWHSAFRDRMNPQYSWSFPPMGSNWAAQPSIPGYPSGAYAAYPTGLGQVPNINGVPYWAAQPSNSRTGRTGGGYASMSWPPIGGIFNLIPGMGSDRYLWGSSPIGMERRSNGIMGPPYIPDDLLSPRHGYPWGNSYPQGPGYPLQMAQQAPYNIWGFWNDSVNRNNEMAPWINTGAIRGGPYVFNQPINVYGSDKDQIKKEILRQFEAQLDDRLDQLEQNIRSRGG